MQIICFEDQLVDRLRPITLARPAYQITCASLRLIDWLQRFADSWANHKLNVFVRPYLQTIQQLDFGLTPPDGEIDSEGVLLVNARLVPRAGLDAVLKQLAASSRSTVVTDPEETAILAARLTAADIAAAQLANEGAPRR